MIVEAGKFEKLVEVRGIHGFDNVEFADRNSMILRTAMLRTSEVGGTVRLYFDSKREEVMSGRRFDPVSGIWLLRPGIAYRVYSSLEIVKPLPAGTTAMVVPTDDALDVLMIIDKPLREGFSGLITFTIIPYRRIEMEAFTSVARLMFFEDTLSETGNSNRTKKRSGSARKPSGSVSVPIEDGEDSDASVVSDKHASPSED